MRSIYGFLRITFPSWEYEIIPHSPRKKPIEQFIGFFVFSEVLKSYFNHILHRISPLKNFIKVISYLFLQLRFSVIDKTILKLSLQNTNCIRNKF